MLRCRLEKCSYFFFFTLSMVICCGFFLVTNILVVVRFGQKHLLNAISISVNVNASMQIDH